ncbi:SDR family oxidoreductase [Brevibacillus fortis]|uniref:SDR family oxidoreductase n=1 Tax=Brevibacillus fortis TaxID=2126352 RepID=UPI002E1C446B|nr:SDR family oxidoreductase [Brevibacillus fortis]
MNILVTGATGFLGKKLSQDLLNEGHTLYLLARNEKKASDLLHSFAEKHRKQVHILLGDVSKKGLGVSENDWGQLSQKIDAMYHIAAYLSFDPTQKPQTYEVNVEGTKNTLQFAEAISSPRFIYVSTAYTIGTETEGKETLYNPERSFVNNYEETKCLAEHVVFSYSDKMETIIVRPSIIIGDSKTGEADTTFGLYGLLKGLRVLKRRASRADGWENQKYRILVDVDVNSNLVPVDYVSSVLVAALTHGEHKEIYHATNPVPPTQQLVVECIKEVLDFPNLVPVPFETDELLSEEEKAFNASMSLFHSYWKRSISFPNDNTKKLLQKVGQSELQMDKEMLLGIMSGFQKQAVLT